MFRKLPPNVRVKHFVIPHGVTHPAVRETRRNTRMFARKHNKIIAAQQFFRYHAVVSSTLLDWCGFGPGLASVRAFFLLSRAQVPARQWLWSTLANRSAANSDAPRNNSGSINSISITAGL